jgi:hypothetical protein
VYSSIGQGDVIWGTPIKCGGWRCDTYAWWAFYSAGYNTGGSIMLPRVIFNSFPYYNKLMPNKKSTLMESSKTLNDVTAEELNEMLFEEFEMIADIPMQQETPQHIAEQELIGYLNYVKPKYTVKNATTSSDLRMRLASKAYNDLISYIGM